MPSLKNVCVGDDVRISLILGPGREWRGVGAVTVDSVPLRDETHPLTIRLDTPEGILYTRYVLDDIRERPRGKVDVLLRATGVPWGRQEYRDEYNQAMVSIGQSCATVEDTVILRLEPVSLVLDQHAFSGFSYTFLFASRKRNIHRLLVNATWELGGSLVGNTVLSQGQCNRPVYKGARKTLFTTACLKTLDQHGSPQGMSYQLGPRGGLIQGFDFQHSPDGTLLQYWPRMASVSSILESPAGSTRLHVIDEHRFKLATRASTVPQHVLFCPDAVEPCEARDLWWHAHQHVYGGLRRHYGIEETVVRPEVGEESYKTSISGDSLRFGLMDEEVDSTHMLHLTADRLLPRLAEQGIRRFFPVCAHCSDVTELGLARKLDNGIHGDHQCASVCASHRYFPSEFWGGIKGWRYMAKRARTLGIEIGCWISPHFSPRAEIFKEHPDWLLRGPDSCHWGGGYHEAIVTADWNTAVYDWVLQDVTRWAEEGGLDYMFIDSWANMGLLQQNFAQDMRTNGDALARLLADIQKLGITAYTFEGISPFGASRFGLRDLRGDKLGVQGGVAGQNDFGWWEDEMDMAYNVCMHVPLRKRSDRASDQLAFRAMANRAYLMPHRISPNYDLVTRDIKLNHIYEQVLPGMRTRRLLPEGMGVKWSASGIDTVWVFKPFELHVPEEMTIERVTADGPIAMTARGKTTLKPWNVYRITDR